MFARYDIWYKAVSDIPYHSDVRLIRKVWSMVSNAVARSSRVRTVALPLSIVSAISLRTFERVVSVELNCLHRRTEISP